MRECPACAVVTDQYYRKHGRCKACDRAATQTYYQAHRERCVARQRAYYWADPARSRGITQRSRAKRKAARLALMRAAKAQPCVDCGVEHPPAVMDFDHVRGVKVERVTVLVNRLAPLHVIRAEIAKCEVRCANCHRLRHAREND